MNQVQLQGQLSSDPDVKDLESGAILVLLNVQVSRPDGSRRDSLPIAVGPSPAPKVRRHAGQATRATVKRAAGLTAGDRVTVTGWLQRRFWSGGDGARMTRLQVVAENVRRS